MRKRKWKNDGIGEISIVPIRDVFPHEAHHFTRWLEENIDVLASQLGLALTIEEREMPVGKLSADLVCLDGQGNRVVIENQLEKSDHDHFGKLMTYILNLNANTGIWITPEPRLEHLTAIENANTNPQIGYAFYLVKVEAIVIDNSRPAPLFTVLAQPSDTPSSIADSQPEHYAIEEEVVSEPIDTSLPPVWVVLPRRDKETYNLFLDKNVIGLGFSHLGDLRKLEPTYDAFKAAWTKGIFGRLFYSNKRTVSIFASMYYRFVHVAAIGDIVVYPPTWYERVIYVGKITGNYQYVKGQHEGYLGRRSVEWLTSFPRDTFSKEALKGISVNLAFFQVRNESFLAELEEKL